MTEPMTLERALEVLAVVTGRAMQGSETRDAYECIKDHLAQQAQAVDVETEVSRIEDAISLGQMTAPMVFTKMRWLLTRALPASTTPDKEG